MKLMRVAVFALLSVTTVLADDPKSVETKPQSMAARTAIDRCDNAIAEAEKACKKAVFEAKYKMMTELQKAQQIALKQGNNAEALAIAAKVKATEEELLGTVTKITVQGAKDWQASGDVKRGVTYTARASGKWCANISERSTSTSGPDGYILKDASQRRVGYLEGRLGENGTPFRIGSGADFTPKEDCQLYLRMNDSAHGDNDGEMTVQLSAGGLATGP